MEFLKKDSIISRQVILTVLHIYGTILRYSKPSINGEHLRRRWKVKDDDLEARRRELELSLASDYSLSDRSKYELIKKIMDVLEESMEDDKRFDDD